MAIWKRKNRDLDFRPDANTSTWMKTARLTQQQRLRLAKWGLYVATIVLSLVVQDVVMSQVRLLGATTDLCVAVILLITVLEGSETGSLFVLIASTLYYFSGSAPGAYCIALLTGLGTLAAIFRQMYWHRSKGSIVLCAGFALMGYELGLFSVGIFSELTTFARLGNFALTGAYSCVCLIPYYDLIHKIGLIGGNTWKE